MGGAGAHVSHFSTGRCVRRRLAVGALLGARRRLTGTGRREQGFSPGKPVPEGWPQGPQPHDEDRARAQGGDVDRWEGANGSTEGQGKALGGLRGAGQGTPGSVLGKAP